MALKIPISHIEIRLKNLQILNLSIINKLRPRLLKPNLPQQRNSIPILTQQLINLLISLPDLPIRIIALIITDIVNERAE